MQDLVKEAEKVFHKQEMSRRREVERTRGIIDKKEI